jgi:hypothetical protein
MRIMPLALLALLAVQNTVVAADRMQFWNLTSTTIVGLSLAPTGTTEFGPNQCANDQDGAVDHDERLRLTGIAPGHYDVRVTDKQGRICMARNVTVSGTGRYAFSLSDEDLQDCRPR